MILLLGCVDTPPDCVVTTSEIGLDEVVVEARDDGDEVRERVTPTDLLTAIAGPSRVEAIDLSGASLPVTVSVAQGDGAIELTDAAPDGCAEEAVRIPVILDVQSDDGRVAVTAATDLAPDLPTGTYWIYLTADLAETDTVPAGAHGAAESGSVKVTWGDGKVTELSARIRTADGARETVLWYAD